MLETKEQAFLSAARILEENGFQIVAMDDTRPWGGFYVIDESEALRFAESFFPEEPASAFQGFQKLSPKILVVKPNTRLSWQYHYRRAEIWKCLSREVAVVTSNNDEEQQQHLLCEGDIIRLAQGERHRLVGTSTWGLVAEIWKHTDPSHPSDEQDIVRVQDDFGRKTPQ